MWKINIRDFKSTSDPILYVDFTCIVQKYCIVLTDFWKLVWDLLVYNSKYKIHQLYWLPQISDVFNFWQSSKTSEIFYVRNSKVSEIFKDLIVLLRHFSKPISSFLDKNILTFSLFSNSGFARSSITGDLGRNSLKRGTEKLHFFNVCCQI